MNNNFKEYIIEMTKIANKIPLQEARLIAQEIGLKLNLKIIFPEELQPFSIFRPNMLFISGSIRRDKPMVGDIDLVCTQELSLSDIQKIKGIKEIWSRGTKQIYFNYLSDNKTILRSVNIFILTDPTSFGAFMLHTTGDNIFNIILRKKAKKKNLKLNQYGIYDIINNKKLAGETEQSIFNVLGMDYIIPKERNINSIIS